MNLSRILNPVVGLTGLLALALSATMAFAEVKEKMKIKVKTDDGVAETVTIENLKVGESNVFVTESGKEVLVTRDEEQLTLEVGGRQIEVKMPKIELLHEHDHGQVERRVFISHDDDHAVHGDHGENVWVDKSGDETLLEDGDGQRIIIRKEVRGNLSDEEMAELMNDIEMDIEIDGDGTEEREVIMIKKIVTETDEQSNEESDD